MPRLILLIGGAVPRCDRAEQRPNHQGVGSPVSGKHNSRLWLTCHAGLHQSVSSSAASHAPRHSPFHAAFRYLQHGQRNLAGPILHPAALMGSRTPFAGLLPRSGRTRAFAPSRPACRSRRFPHRPSCRLIAARCVLVMVDRCAIRGQLRPTSGSCLPVMVRPCERRRGDPALGFFLLQGCGRVTGTRIPMVVLTTGRRQPLGLTLRVARPYPLMGFRRPSCADVPDLSGSHPLARSCSVSSGVAGPSAYFEANASPIRRSRSTAGAAPCLRFRTCHER